MVFNCFLNFNKNDLKFYLSKYCMNWGLRVSWQPKMTISLRLHHTNECFLLGCLVPISLTTTPDDYFDFGFLKGSYPILHPIETANIWFIRRMRNRKRKGGRSSKVSKDYDYCRFLTLLPWFDIKESFEKKLTMFSEPSKPAK